MRKLFELLSVGIETKIVSEVAPDAFSEMSLKDWRELRGMADKQGVSAIVLDGLHAMVAAYGKEKVAPKIPMGEWKQFVYEWIGIITKVEHQNKRQMMVLEDMASRWTAKDCRVMVMKGQASGMMYPRPQHRSPGDIDCYLIYNNDNLDENRKGYHIGNEVARETGAKVDESWYKHSVINYKCETFENHQYFVHTRDGKRGKFLEKELESQLRIESLEFKKLTENTVIPPVLWTAMFLTYHACTHFISEGLRLKQLLDWAMLLKEHQDDIDWPIFYAFCERHHLRRFADAATAISAEYLNVNLNDNLNGCYKGSPYADCILQSTLYDDDYVFGSGEGNWHNRWHLVRNLFHYRWKYEDICETSPWRQLWYYASGYLFHTE